MPPQLSVISGNASASATAASQTLTGLEKLIHDQATHYGFSTKNISELCSQINTAESLRNLDHDRLRQVIINAFERAKSTNRHQGAVDLAKQLSISDLVKAAELVNERQGKIIPPRPEMMEELKKRVAANDAVAAAQRAPKQKNWLHDLSDEQKVNGGIWMAGAALSLLGTYHAARNSFVKDDEGKTHIQWTQAGVSLLQACLAGGCAYMGAQVLRAR